MPTTLPVVAACLLALAGAACSDDPTATPDAAVVDAAPDAPAVVAPEPSPGCTAGRTTYVAGTTTAGALDHGGLSRTFRVHVPPGYAGTQARPVVLMLHGGGGSGRQLEEASSNMNVVADREQVIAVYPDGTGTIRTWNAGGCCGAAVRDDIDDVGFVAALLDHVEAELCVDRARVFVGGMSNGGMMTHRLACELAPRIAAVAPVAATDMTATCSPARPIPVLHIHGTEDGHVPWEGGIGCGPAGVAFVAVPASMEQWRMRNACTTTTALLTEQGDGRCEAFTGCATGATTALCTVTGGGHSWPGGAPNADLADCPADGAQSTTFPASEVMWSFFATHPRQP